MRLRYTLALFLFASTLPLSAQAVQRAFVSAVSGSDSNTATGCPATAPCRWFAGAIPIVDPGGEIVAMDTGAYGALTITKSIAIVAAPGVYAGISVFSGNGITIATAGINVTLRGLTINSMGASTYGIHMTNGAKLTVENCVISNFSSSTYAGLFVTTAANVGVANSTFRDNFSGMVFANSATASVADSVLARNARGIWVTDFYGDTSQTTTVNIARSVMYGNTGAVYVYNISAGGTSRAFVSDSTISGNSHGVLAYASAGTGHATASNNRISGNDYGLSAVAGSGHVIATGNTVTKNAFYGLFQDSTSLFESASDNVVRDNATANYFGTITTFAKM